MTLGEQSLCLALAGFYLLAAGVRGFARWLDSPEFAEKRREALERTKEEIAKEEARLEGVGV